MKKSLEKLFLLGIIVLGSNLFAQVGINTESPTSTLDVNGEARIRQIETLSSVPIYVLAPNANGVLSKIETSAIISGNVNQSQGSEVKKLQYYGNYDNTKILISGPFEFRMTGVNSTSNLDYQIRMRSQPSGNVPIYFSLLTGWGETPGGDRSIITFTTSNWDQWQTIRSITIARNGHNVLATVDFRSAPEISEFPITYNIFVQRIDGDSVKTLIVTKY